MQTITPYSMMPSNANSVSNGIHLTEEQQEIVRAPLGHYLINAVAGSGKTTTLAYRIKHLLVQGEDARRMVVLMFNKAAQLDFVRKLRQIIPEDIEHPEVRTFHAMGYRLYQRFVNDGALPGFVSRPLGEKETQFILWRLILEINPKEKHASIKRNKKEHVETAYQFLESVKSQLLPPEEVLANAELNEHFSYLPEVFEQFEMWRKENRRISYSDMLYDPVRAIQNAPHLERLVSNKVNMILVDEYQDTNDIQHTLLTLIAGTRAQVTVVGDPNQTIYEFRGAKPEYMLNKFSAQFRDAKTLNLSYTFRYGHQSALMANHLIRHNEKRHAALCLSHATTPNTQVRQLYSNNGIQACLDIIYEYQETKQTEGDSIAVLLRLWSQSYTLELALLEKQIDYQLPRPISVFDSEPFLLLESILSLTSGNFGLLSSQERYQRILLFLRLPHIGLSENHCSAIAQTLAKANERWGIALLNLIPKDIKPFQSKKLQQLSYALSTVETRAKTTKTALNCYAEETKLYEGIRSISLSHEQAEEKIAVLKAMASYLDKLDTQPSKVLERLSELKSTAQNMDKKGPIITTIHRAKGLEWDWVIIPDFDSRHYPHQIPGNALNETDIEAERRLLYVAATRAKKELRLISPKKLSKESSECKPSRFEKELNLGECTQLATALYSSAQNLAEIINQSNSSTDLSSVSRRYVEKIKKETEEQQEEHSLEEPCL